MLYKCPLCDHLTEYLTNNHTLTAHGMTRRQLVAKHGNAQPVKVDPHKSKENDKIGKIMCTLAPQTTSRNSMFKNGISHF